MHMVISYDIRNDRRRRKVAKVLEGFGWRVQYSVFEAHLSTTRLKDLESRLRKAILRREDSIRVYRLCGGCSREVHLIGTGERIEKPGTTVVEGLTASSICDGWERPAKHPLTPADK